MKKQSKSEQLQIRLSSEEKRAIKRLATGTGKGVSQWVLETLLPKNGNGFLKLVSELRGDKNSAHALASLNDFLMTLSRGEFGPAVSTPPPKKLSALLQNQVAAMVELRAHQLGIEGPDWLASIPPLEQPYFGSELASLRAYLLTVSPPPFRKRNIFIDSAVGDRV